MPIQFSESGGNVVTVHVTGTLVKADYEDFVPKFEKLVPRDGKLRLMFDMIGFHGWSAGAMWEDIKFDTKHYSDIERLATVGDQKWQHEIATLFKPFTKAESRYFDVEDTDKAREWLAEK